MSGAEGSPDPLQLVERLIALLLENRARDLQIADLRSKRPTMWSYRDDNDLLPSDYHAARDRGLDAEKRDIDVRIESLSSKSASALVEVGKILDEVSTWSLGNVLAQVAVNRGWVRSQEGRS